MHPSLDYSFMPMSVCDGATISKKTSPNMQPHTRIHQSAMHACPLLQHFACRLYNVAYMATTTVLAMAAAYGMFETARGSYYIMTASRRRARVSLACPFSHAYMRYIIHRSAAPIPEC